MPERRRSCVGPARTLTHGRRFVNTAAVEFPDMTSNSYGPDLMARLDALAAFSDVPGTVTRLYLSPSHRAAIDAVCGWMRDAGLTVTVDPLGTITGRLEGAAPGLPALMLGSHIDSVRDAGRYDGTLGVLSAIAAAGTLARRPERLPFALEVAAFGDEENVRFPTTLLSSRALAGVVDPAELVAEDDHGVTVREALRAAGFDPDRIGEARRRPEDLLAYVELHIEQGPVLEAEGLALGVVDAINGRVRLDVTVEGTAGHAGTVPTTLRRDALTAAAEMVLAVEQAAREDTAIVATVGTLKVEPGASNVIPGRVRFSIDLRSATDGVRDAAAVGLQATIAAIGDRRGVGVSLSEPYRSPATPCDPRLIDALSETIERLGQRPRRLGSGAGHDAMAMAAICPVGMLFLRCAGGISHNPAEAITVDDADLAVRALIDFAERFMPPVPRS